MMPKLLRNAIASNDPATVEKLIEGAELTLKNEALRYAVICGHTETAELLLNRGAQVDSTNSEETALLYAVMCGKTEVTKLLLNHGAQVDSTLRYAVKGDKTKVVTLLCRDMLMKDPNTAKPVFLDENKQCSDIWDETFAGISAYLENEKAGTNKNTKLTGLQETAKKSSSLAYLAFWANSKSNKVSETDNSSTPTENNSPRMAP